MDNYRTKLETFLLVANKHLVVFQNLGSNGTFWNVPFFQPFSNRRSGNHQSNIYPLFANKI
jgi:hypothetical protein